MRQPQPVRVMPDGTVRKVIRPSDDYHYASMPGWAYVLIGVPLLMMGIALFLEYFA